MSDTTQEAMNAVIAGFREQAAEILADGRQAAVDFRAAFDAAIAEVKVIKERDLIFEDAMQRNVTLRLATQDRRIADLEAAVAALTPTPPDPATATPQ